MNYQKTIELLIHQVPETIFDLTIPRKRSSAPTQAFSEFLTNREQGDWAEILIFQAINTVSQNYVVVHYGKTDNRIAGEEGFTEFYDGYQDELDLIGKRPDLLIFHKKDYHESWKKSIADKSKEELDVIVPKAIAGLEVRSSSHLIDKYDQYMKNRSLKNLEQALNIKKELLENFHDVFLHKSKSHWIDILNGINADTISSIDFRVPGWRSNERVLTANDLLKELKECIQEVQKRDFLSITPKVEDIKVVYKWIQTYGVPHYYFQVFFDKVYGISFENILKLTSQPDLEGVDYFVEGGDAKNQNKTTIKINSKIGKEIAEKVDMPEHHSNKKELPRGKLLFHVMFNGGKAYINVDKLCDLLGIKGGSF